MELSVANRRRVWLIRVRKFAQQRTGEGKGSRSKGSLFQLLSKLRVERTRPRGRHTNQFLRICGPTGRGVRFRSERLQVRLLSYAQNQIWWPPLWFSRSWYIVEKFLSWVEVGFQPEGGSTPCIQFSFYDLAQVAERQTRRVEVAVPIYGRGGSNPPLCTLIP